MERLRFHAQNVLKVSESQNHTMAQLDAPHVR